MKKLLFLLMFLVSNSYALSLSDIRGQVRIIIKDNNSTRQKYTDAQVDTLINETHREVVNATWVIRKSTTIELVSGTTFYSMPSDFINVKRVTFRNENLRETTFAQLDGRFSDSNWLEIGGFPERYYQDTTQVNMLGIYPYPDSTTSTGTLKVQYFAQENTLSSDSDQPFNEDPRYQQYSDLLIYRTCFMLFSIDEDLQPASIYQQLYSTRLQDMITRVGEYPNYLPGFGSSRSQ